MKRIFTLISVPLFLLSSSSLKAQIIPSSPWTWINGANTTNGPGVYGIQGTPAPASRPGARGGGSAFWKDASGNFWLFGGYDFSNAFLNDLWKYEPTSNQWTWIRGANTTNQFGTYGTAGTAAPANQPGARYLSASRTDAAGNVWLFGGYGLDAGSAATYKNLNDLWKYNPSSNQWTWVNGANTNNQSGIYGTQGTPDTTTRPGARYSSASWTDADGNFWLFGGLDNSAGGLEYFNDLWKYNPATNQWTWINGANTTNGPGVYGTQGIPAPANRPGARSGSTSWADAAGNLWLFGGTISNTYLNDLWKYNPAASQWTWVNGANTANQFGTYGTQGTPAPANRPGARSSGTASMDAAGNLWLFGGYGLVGSGAAGYLSDLWKYEPSANQWTWVKGTNTTGEAGTYGTLGTPASANKPGARAPSASWTDAAGNFWLFGGAINGGFLNDLWKLNSASSAPLPVTISTIKAYQQNANIAVEWQAEGESAIRQYDVEKSTDGIAFTKVAVRAATGNNGGGANYAWLDIHPVTGNNFYRISSVSVNGGLKYSRVVKVTVGGKPAHEVYPNPVTNGAVQLQFISQAKGTYRVQLVNTLGQVVLVEQIAHEAGSSAETIDISGRIGKGQYTLLITAPDKSRQAIKIIY